jgi:hypothetical protein
VNKLAMIGKKTAMACFEVLSQKLPGRDCGKLRENSDYLVSDTRLVGSPEHPRLRSISLACFSRMLWIQMVYAKATERSLSP